MNREKLAEKTEELADQIEFLKARITEERIVLRETQETVKRLIREIRGSEAKLVHMEGRMAGLTDARWMSC